MFLNKNLIDKKLIKISKRDFIKYNYKCVMYNMAILFYIANERMCTCREIPINLTYYELLNKIVDRTVFFFLLFSSVF